MSAQQQVQQNDTPVSPMDTFSTTSTDSQPDVVHPNQALAYANLRKWVEREREAEAQMTTAAPETKRPVRTVYVGFRARGDIQWNWLQAFRLVPTSKIQRMSTETDMDRLTERFLPITPLKKALKITCRFDTAKISSMGAKESRALYFRAWYWLQNFIKASKGIVYEETTWTNPGDMPVAQSDQDAWDEAIRLTNERHCGFCVMDSIVSREEHQCGFRWEDQSFGAQKETASRPPTPASFEPTPLVIDDECIVQISSDGIEVETTTQRPHQGFPDWRHDKESFNIARKSSDSWLTLTKHNVSPGQDIMEAICTEEKAEGAKEFADWDREAEESWDMDNPYKWSDIPVHVITIRHAAADSYCYRTLSLPTQICIWDQWQNPRCHTISREEWERDDVILASYQDTWLYLEAREYIGRERINHLIARANEPQNNKEKVTIRLQMCSGKERLDQDFLLVNALDEGPADTATPGARRCTPIYCQHTGLKNRSLRVSLMNQVHGC